MRRQRGGRGPKQAGAGRARVVGRLLLLTSPLLRTEAAAAAAAERLAETKRGCRKGGCQRHHSGKVAAARSLKTFQCLKEGGGATNPDGHGPERFGPTGTEEGLTPKKNSLPLV